MKLNIRNIISFLVAKMFIFSGIANRAKKKALRGDYILSIYFHKPTAKEFEKCINWLLKNNFVFIKPSDLERIYNKEIPFTKGGIILTIDDGWISNEANVVEIANKYKIPVTIFVSTEPVEKGTFWWSYFIEAKKYNLNLPTVSNLKKLPNHERLNYLEQAKKEIFLNRHVMTVEQIKKAAASKFITIGGHTHTHPILTNCSDQLVDFELEYCKRKLEEWTGQEVNYFAYPNGDYANREIKSLKKMKYRLAFTSNKKYLTSDSLENNFEIPRFGYLENASFSENICRILGIWNFNGRLRR